MEPKKMKVTKSSSNLIELIKRFEGFSSKPYLCPAKVPTIGYGSTRYADGKKVTLKDTPISEAKGLELLNDTLKQYELAVDAFCVDTINQNQFDALVDFAYNLGTGNLKSSTLLKKVNADPKDHKISEEFLKWNRAGGKVLKGLTARRVAEAELYFKDI
jgi:lysozyme